ncbi:MAG TPA: DUF2723 domain-containing protein [Vicinamibacterales bacterium]|nr:DUF2723 domain-containing protein [Vicinamibacterales bacterium]
MNNDARPVALNRRDVETAAAVAVITLAFFIVTLRPDVGGTEDSPKFQFVGRVLGTSHSPGYPFYAMATWVFGHLVPIGTLAYRINLFSAVCGALACVCVFLTARRFGVTRVLSAAAALAAATSYPVWSNSVTAEVYMLAAVLSAAAIYFLIAFAQTGVGAASSDADEPALPTPPAQGPRAGRLYAACAMWAMGFGNHLTIAGILPAALLYGIAKDRRVLRPRIAITAAAIGVLGVLQYSFIAIRTLQGAPYLEARATTIQGVFDVIIARDVSWARFYQAQSAVAAIEVPMLINGLRVHMGLIPLLLIAIGLGIAIWKRHAEVLLAFGAAAGTLAFIANLWGDVVGFITPVCVQLWPIAAFALHWLVSRFWPSRAALNAAGTVAMILPATHGAGNWQAIATLRQPGEERGVRALYSQLPPRSAIVAENYWLARLINYMHFSGEVNPDPNPRVLDNDPNDVRAARDEGLEIYAFEGATHWLAAQGFRFERTNIARRPFESWFEEQRRGTLVVAAAAGRALPFEWLPAATRGQRPANYSVFIRAIGEGDASVEQRDDTVVVERPAGDGRMLTIRSSDAGPQVVIGDDVLAAIDRGLIVVALSRDGGVIGRWTFRVDEHPGVELPPAAYVLGEINRACATLRPGQPVDVAAVLSDGRWLTSLEGFGKGTIALDTDEPASRWRFWQSHGRGTSTIDAARSHLVFEGYRATRPVFSLQIPPQPSRAVATLQSGEVSAVTVCGGRIPRLPDTGALDVTAAEDGWFGGGWHLGERAGSQRFRWSQRTSSLTWRMDRADRVRMLLRLRPAHPAGARLQAAINGAAATTCVLAPGQWSDCAIELDAAALREGINQLTLTSDTVSAASDHPGDPRELAFVMQASRVRVGR